MHHHCSANTVAVWKRAWVLRISVEASGTVLCQYYLSGCWMNVLRALSSNYALERTTEGRTWRGLPHADHFSPSFHVFLLLFSFGFVPAGFFFFFFCPSVPPKSLPPTLLLLKIYKVGTARSGSCWEKTISWKWLKATQSRRLGCWFSATASHYYRKSFASVFVQQKAFSFFSLSLRKVDYNSCFSCELPSEASKVRQRMRVVLAGSAVVTTVTALVCEFKDRLIVD